MDAWFRNIVQTVSQNITVGIDQVMSALIHRMHKRKHKRSGQINLMSMQ
jgi:hypothetical protein